MEIAATIGAVLGILLAILTIAVPMLLLTWACIAIVKKMSNKK